MTGDDPRSVFLDTNVLLAATDADRSIHTRALRVLNEWPVARTSLFMSGQVLREYLVVATRPLDANGLGLDKDAALANATAFRGRVQVLDETLAVVDKLVALFEETECKGNRIHDANIVACALAHGVPAIVTANTRDFAPFAHHLEIVNLLEV